MPSKRFLVGLLVCRLLGVAPGIVGIILPLMSRSSGEDNIDYGLFKNRVDGVLVDATCIEAAGGYGCTDFEAARSCAITATVLTFPLAILTIRPLVKGYFDTVFNRWCLFISAVIIITAGVTIGTWRAYMDKVFEDSDDEAPPDSVSLFMFVTVLVLTAASNFATCCLFGTPDEAPPPDAAAAAVNVGAGSTTPTQVILLETIGSSDTDGGVEGLEDSNGPSARAVSTARGDAADDDVDDAPPPYAELAHVTGETLEPEA